jgi:threonine dehydrogenase-like Zn-dependent dehydrogenase
VTSRHSDVFVQNAPSSRRELHKRTMGPAPPTLAAVRAAVMNNWQLRVDDIPAPVPGPGQVLTRVLACGICGSDLHLLQHGAEQIRLRDELAAEQPPDPLSPVPFQPDADVVMGHEFCCEVVELGQGCDNVREGDVIVSMPGAFDDRGVHALGFSNHYPGGYAELMVLNELTALKVPAGLPPRLAALTEPLAVGVHAVGKSGITAGEAALVLGCGPVGVAVITDLRRRGIGPIIAADYSAKRRALAVHLGADEVVDPRQEPAIAAWRRVDGTHPLVVFEAVGVPGMLDAAMRMAPRGSRVLVVGVCMEQDHLQPMIGIGKELAIQFALGYDPAEFAGTLLTIAEGRVDFEPMLTGSVNIDGVPQAFTDLANPDAHAKILVEAR